MFDSRGLNISGVEKLKALGYVPLLHGLPTKKLKELGNAMRLEEFANGKIIVNQGDPGDSFFIV